MYVSPIEIIMEDIKRSIDTNTMKIIQGYNINVDKDELIKALSYDRDQYNKGYEDAKKEMNFLSKDDIETILINLNASKEDLCNRGLWSIAEEYQQLIYKIVVNFADTLGEKVNEYTDNKLFTTKRR